MTKRLTGITVDNQATLAQANAALLAMMSKPVKVRLSTNATGSGVNAASYVPSFRYPSLHDALSIIQPGDFIAIGDIKRYYIAFPFATEAYYNFGVEIANKVYYYLIARFWHLGHLWPQQDHPSAKICEMVYEKTEKPFSPYLPISLSPYLPISLSHYPTISLSPFLPFPLSPCPPSYVLRPLSSVLCPLSSRLITEINNSHVPHIHVPL